MIFIKTSHGLVNSHRIVKIKTHGSAANPTVFYDDGDGACSAMCDIKELAKLGIKAGDYRQ